MKHDEIIEQIIKIDERAHYKVKGNADLEDLDLNLIGIDRRT